MGWTTTELIAVAPVSVTVTWTIGMGQYGGGVDGKFAVEGEICMLATAARVVAGASVVGGTVAGGAVVVGAGSVVVVGGAAPVVLVVAGGAVVVTTGAVVEAGRVVVTRGAGDVPA